MMELTAADQSLVKLGKLLLADGYTFTTVTPATHRRVLKRDEEQKTTTASTADEALRDFFGWNKPTLRISIPENIIKLLIDADFVEVDGELAKSKVRFSTIDSIIFMHSAFPTKSDDAVFFGPDSYRFVRLLKHEVFSANKIIDIGAGAGVGGLCLANFLFKKNGKMPKVVLTDVNHEALRFSRINATINDFDNAEVVESDILAKAPKDADVIIANPPFVIDASERIYRHGGENFGSELSADIVKQSLAYLNGAGQLVVYTGSCFVKGEDQFLKSVEPVVANLKYDYFEVDPDIFGEQLNTPEYSDVERTAAVGLNINFSGS